MSYRSHGYTKSTSPNYMQTIVDCGADALVAHHQIEPELAGGELFRDVNVPSKAFGELVEALEQIPPAGLYVLTCASSQLAPFAVAELQAQVDDQVRVLAGGTQAWSKASQPLESGPSCLASAPIDRYCRPYEGTDNSRSAMQGYLDREFGQVEQLARDRTHGFFVL